MKVTLVSAGIDTAPPGALRVRFTDEPRGTRRFVRETRDASAQQKGPPSRTDLRNGKVSTPAYDEWLEIGAGPQEERSARAAIVLVRAAIRAAKAQKAKRLALDLAPDSILRAMLPSDDATAFQLVAENAVMANLDFRTFKTRPKEGWPELTELMLCGETSPAVKAGAKRGQVIGEGVNACRELSNTPGGSMTPRGLANAAKAAVAGLPVSVKTLGREAISKAGMGLLAGIGAGSAQEPTFTVLSYQGGKPKDRPIVLAGKGITFDSGGLNIKPSSGIYEMHLDMSGGAAVIHAVALAAQLGIKKNVIGLVPAAENLLGQNATRPGDILTSLSGKTVEVTDTDAEGRLVLADAITYAKRFNPSVVVDAATLTGAALVALGHHASGLMTRDDALAERLLQLGESSGDYLWRLPLWDEYAGVVKSDFADLQNHSISRGRYAGATNGAIFLWQFAKELDCPWAHLDIAPRMTAAPGEELAKGAAGAPVRLLLAFIESW